MSKEETREPKSYYYVIDGSFRQKVDKSYEGAITREWKTPDGKSGVKHERVVTALTGIIENVQFFDGDFGKTVQITLDADERGINPIITLSVAGREGTDFLRKLPSIDLNEEVRLYPYAFQDDNGNEKKGITLTQRDPATGNFDAKIQDFFRDFEKKENKNGMPNPPKERDEMDKDDWKIYFLQVTKFLVEYTQNKIVPKLQDRAFVKKNTVTKTSASHEEEISSDDIPF